VQSFDYINIDKTGFQYRVASWYSPAFIAHSVDQITKFETNNNTSNHYNPNVDKKLTEELIIKNLQLDTTQFKIDISTRLLNKNIVEIVKLEIENRDSTFENILNSFNQYLMKANELNLQAIEQLNTINTKIDRNNAIITNLGNHIKTGGTNAE